VAVSHYGLVVVRPPPIPTVYFEAPAAHLDGARVGRGHRHAHHLLADEVCVVAGEDEVVRQRLLHVLPHPALPRVHRAVELRVGHHAQQLVPRDAQHAVDPVATLAWASKNLFPESSISNALGLAPSER